MTKTIFQRLADVNKEVEAIKKTQKNEQQKFMFRGIDQVMVEIHNLFAKHEIFISQYVVDQKREERPSRSGGLNIWSIVTYQFTFYAPDGSHVTTEMVGEAMDTGDKGNNKCVSVALKYALINMFTIPTEEQKQVDPDRTSTELVLSIKDEDIALINKAETLEELLQTCKDMSARLGKSYRKIINDYYTQRKTILEQNMSMEIADDVDAALQSNK